MYLRLANFKVTVPRWTCHPDSESDVPGPRRPGGLLRALPDLRLSATVTGPPDVQVGRWQCQSRWQWDLGLTVAA